MGRLGGLLGALRWTVLLLCLGTGFPLAQAEQDSPNLGTIAFASLGRAHFAYDLFGVKLPDVLGKERAPGILSYRDLEEIQLTDGVSINYDGQLVEGSARSAVLDRFRREGYNGELLI
jgi:hypothetical protein